MLDLVVPPVLSKSLDISVSISSFLFKVKTSFDSCRSAAKLSRTTLIEIKNNALNGKNKGGNHFSLCSHSGLLQAVTVVVVDL